MVLDNEKTINMQDMLNHYPVYFPKRNEELYTLKQFLDEATNDKYQLPIIVNVTSVNNYGRSIKHILKKNSTLLLIDINQLDSIVAEYHRSTDGRHNTHRHRLTKTQGKMANKATNKFRNMKKLSKSLATLNTTNQNTISSSNNNEFVGETDSTFNQRNLVKNLNDKHRTSFPLCRIPIQYQRYFELLNENDQSIEPYRKLTDLILIEPDANDPDKRIEKWPNAFFLRSPCASYTKRPSSSVGNDLSTDVDSQNNVILLNDDVLILPAGQILTILDSCMAAHTKILEKEMKELQPPTSPSPSYFSPSWIRDKSRMFFSKKRRQTQQPERISHEIIRCKSYQKKPELYLKCQTQEGDIVYICLEESGLFSPLNLPSNHLKTTTTTTEATRMDISGVFQLKELASNFRFPISVRHLDGSIAFDNIYAPSIINRLETPTKLRLLMPYNEHVIFACPLNVVPSKILKSSSPYIILPLSVHADLEIQPCINMYDISRTEDYQKLLEICFELIEQYQNKISLIHFPLQLTNDIERKPLLHKKRSQSESFVEYFENDLTPKFRHSDDHLQYYTDNSSSISSPLRYRDSYETIKQKLSTDVKQPTIRHSGYYSKIKSNKQLRESEDEIYQDVDKIYDYIRSGDVTDEVQKIQAKERMYNSMHAINMPSPHRRVS